MDLGLEKYRYTLERGKNDSACLFIMLNPSTADEQNDDQTIRVCRKIAEENGFTSFRVVNLFALRSKNPADLNLADDPVGSKNNDVILEEVKKIRENNGKLVAAWGDGNNNELHEKRSREVLDLLQKEKIAIWTLGKTRSGNPCHPLNPRCQSPFQLKLA